METILNDLRHVNANLGIHDLKIPLMQFVLDLLDSYLLRDVPWDGRHLRRKLMSIFSTLLVDIGDTLPELPHGSGWVMGDGDPPFWVISS